MARYASGLRLVAESDPPRAERPTAGADLVLLASILLVALLPIAGQLARGGWGQGTVGFATVMALLSGRELYLELRRRARSRR